ncbi:MAG: VanW family protein [Clostridiales bacterium]|jgi:vancomycin resistance protein YoaR|nr:VanW family protein [Clostridiales bacterium]
MSDQSKKNVRDFIKLFCGALIVFSVLLGVGFCGYLVATNGGDKAEAANALTNASPPPPISTQPPSSAPTVPPDDHTIAKNIYVNGVSVGGLTPALAEQLLWTAADSDDLADRLLTVAGEKGTYELKYADIGATYDFAAAAQKAYNLTRGGDPDGISAVSLKTARGEIAADVTFDEAMLETFVDDVCAKEDVPAKEPSMKLSDGEFTFAEGENGKSAEKAALLAAASESVRLSDAKSLAVTFALAKPKLTVADIRDCTDLLGSTTTSFTGGLTAPRNVNIANAVSKVNNTCLEPGQVLSMNKALGAMTYENGYRESATIVGNKYVDDFGGGVCQVAGTVYQSALKSEMEIVERHNHSRKVTYLDWGFDATLSTPVLDLKIRNDRSLPVLLVGYVEGNTVTFKVYGKETRPEGREIKFGNEYVETYYPGADVVTYDSSLPKDARVVEQAAITGYTYRFYKYIYIDGLLTDTILINKSTYRNYPAYVRVGTGAPVPETTPDPPPEDTSRPDDVPPPVVPSPEPEPTPDLPLEPIPVPDPAQSLTPETVDEPAVISE